MLGVSGGSSWLFTTMRRTKIVNSIATCVAGAVMEFSREFRGFLRAIRNVRDLHSFLCTRVLTTMALPLESKQLAITSSKCDARSGIPQTCNGHSARAG
jgi:hypothetical protein